MQPATQVLGRLAGWGSARLQMYNTATGWGLARVEDLEQETNHSE